MKGAGFPGWLLGWAAVAGLTRPHSYPREGARPLFPSLSRSPSPLERLLRKPKEGEGGRGSDLL